MRSRCERPLSLETMVSYQLDELDEASTLAVEEHYFECSSCSEHLSELHRLKDDVSRLVAHGQITASVSAEFIEFGTMKGLSIRRYAMNPGEGVACTAAPEDDFVAVYLGIGAEPAERVDVVVDWVDLKSQSKHRHVVEDVALDTTTDQVVLLFAGSQIREFPKSRWNIETRIYPPGQRTEALRLGPYTMNHTPWEER